MLCLVSPEQFVPLEHPIRVLKPRVDELLRELSPRFDQMYAQVGRPSVPPEHLLKAMVLIALFSVRSERQFCEQLGYNLLFRWFLDMDMTDRPFDATVFSHNRDRLMDYEVAAMFLQGTVGLAEELGLMSDEHFSVDGSLIEAWASMKSFRPKHDNDGDNNGFADFKGTKRSNDTHESKTDPEAKLFRKGRGKEAKLAYMAHVLMENRNALVADFTLTEANGTAERDAGLKLAKRAKKRRRPKGRTTLAADKNYDTRAFVASCRAARITPHVAQFQHAHRSSAIDGRTTRHRGYHVSQTARLLIEKIFGWMKAVAGFRRSRYRGRRKTAFAGTIVMATYNLLRISKLLPAA
jgi:transposase